MSLSAAHEPTPTTVDATVVTEAPEPAATVDSTTTSCLAVAHIGDSLSVALTSPSYLPYPEDRLDAQYRNVGVETVIADSTGGRSIVETVSGKPNAQTGMNRLVDDGYDGCWVLAMGTNDAANQAVGGRVGSAARIDRLMAVAGSNPVLWLTVRTRRDSGPYADVEMEGWNAALADACEQYPNMRVYDWAAEAEDDWFLDDGIHFTSFGSAERARRTATALAKAFPTAGETSETCFVTS